MKPFLLGVILVLIAHALISRFTAQGAPEPLAGRDVGTNQARLALRALSQASWVDLAPLQEPRQEVAVAALDNALYVVGGFVGGGGTVGTAEVYDPGMDRWQFAPPLPIEVNHAAAAAVGGKIYVIGGHPPSGPEAVDAVYAFDPSTATWARRASMPTARGALTVAVADGKIYAAGGSPRARENDLAVYDPVADVWTALPPMPTPRNHLASGAIDGRVYVAGGRSDVTGISNVLEVYDPATNSWAQRATMPTARGGIGAAAANGVLYVFGGEGNRNHPRGIFDQVEAYDPTTDSWSSLPPMAVPRHGINAATLGNRIYIPGGATVEGFGVVATHQALQLD